MIPMDEFERQLLDRHVCALTHSRAIAFARKVEVSDKAIANLLAAAVLRSNDEVEAFDEQERTGVVKEALEPTVLYRYDPDYDDRRGGSHELGVYRTKAAAQALADQYNQSLLDKINATAIAEYDKQMKRWRAFSRDTMPIKPTPITDMVEYATKVSKWKLDHYWTEALEFDG